MVRWIHGRLLRFYGAPRPFRGRSALDQLICTLLSQNTTDVNSLEAFRRLKARFPAWHTAAAADEREIASAIHVAGLSNTKARRIRQILARVRVDARGRYSLAFLRRMPPRQARDYLLSLPGVGAKTAACTLLFAFGMPIFPVDTHIHRVAARLGLIGPRVSAEQAHDVLGAAVPPELCHDLHLLLILHGRRLCRSRNPRCAGCPLRERCPSRRGTPGRAAH